MIIVLLTQNKSHRQSSGAWALKRYGLRPALCLPIYVLCLLRGPAPWKLITKTIVLVWVGRNPPEYPGGN